MATKATKSLTINATKFELANALNVDSQTGKLQLMAKDVVLSEAKMNWRDPIFLLVDVDFSPYLDYYAHYTEMLSNLAQYIDSHGQYILPYTAVDKNGDPIPNWSAIGSYPMDKDIFVCLWVADFDQYWCYKLPDNLYTERGNAFYYGNINSEFEIPVVSEFEDYTPIKLRCRLEALNRRLLFNWDSVIYQCTSLTANDPVTVYNITGNSLNASSPVPREVLMVGATEGRYRFIPCVGSNKPFAGTYPNHGAIYTDGTDIKLVKFDDTHIISVNTLA